MANYPSLSQSKKTRVKPIAGMVSDLSEGGIVRGRDLFSVYAVEIDLYHDLISDADKATLDTFYDTYRHSVVNFTFDGDSSLYEVIFKTPIAYTWRAPGYWDAKLSLEGKQV